MAREGRADELLRALRRYLSSTNEPHADALRSVRAIVVQAVQERRTIMNSLMESADLFSYFLDRLNDRTLLLASIVCKHWRSSIHNLRPRTFVHLVFDPPMCPRNIQHGLLSEAGFRIDHTNCVLRRLCRGFHKDAARAWLLQVDIVLEGSRLMETARPAMESEWEIVDRVPDLEVAAEQAGLQLANRSPCAPVVRWLDIAASCQTDLLPVLEEINIRQWEGLEALSCHFDRPPVDGPSDGPSSWLSVPRQGLFYEHFRPSFVFQLTSLTLNLGVQVESEPGDWEALASELPLLKCLKHLRWRSGYQDYDWAVTSHHPLVDVLLESVSRIPTLEAANIWVDSRHEATECKTATLEKLRGHASLRELNLAAGRAGSRGNIGDLLAIASTLPVLESLQLEELALETTGRFSNQALPADARPLAMFLETNPQLRRLGIVYEAATAMYWPYVSNGTQLAPSDWLLALEVAEELQSPQPWDDPAPGRDEWELLNECELEGDAMALYSRCKLIDPLPNASLWRLLRPPVAISPFQPTLLRPYCRLEHLSVFINSPGFSYLHDLSHACAHCMPRLKTLRLEMHSPTETVVGIVAGLWWLVKPPQTLAGKLCLKRLCIMYSEPVPDEMVDNLHHYLSRYLGHACAVTIAIEDEAESLNLESCTLGEMSRQRYLYESIGGQESSPHSYVGGSMRFGGCMP